MNALVTGGAGFIGSTLVSLLLCEGWRVTVLDDLSSGHRSNLDGRCGVELCVGDVRDPHAVDRVMTGVDVVFHLAASVGNKRSIDDPIRDAQVNLVGTITVLEAMRRHGTPCIVTSSSAGVFGELVQLPIREDHPTDPVSPYGVSKLAEEKICLAYAKLYDMRVVCLRYFNVYGPNQRFDAYGNVIPIFAQQILRGQPVTVFGDGEQTRDFVHARDVANANYRAAIRDSVSGVFNIGSGEAISVNGLVALMADVSNTVPVVRHGPPRAGDVRHSRADISAARSAFGYAPAVSLREGLEEYMEWVSRPQSS